MTTASSAAFRAVPDMPQPILSAAPVVAEPLDLASVLNLFDVQGPPQHIENVLPFSK